MVFCSAFGLRFFHGVSQLGLVNMLTRRPQPFDTENSAQTTRFLCSVVATAPTAIQMIDDGGGGDDDSAPYIYATRRNKMQKYDCVVLFDFDMAKHEFHRSIVYAENSNADLP